MEELFWRYLPKRGLSRLAGRFARTSFSRRLIPAYIRHFNIDVEPVKRPLHEFENLLDFFIRELRPETRPIDPVAEVVSPVDGVISQFGAIEEGTMLQAKGITYSLHELLGQHEAYVEKFRNGNFVVIYLSPTDYHRIHMPVAGKIEEVTYIPGELYPVNQTGVRLIPGLFARNERLISYIHTSFGYVALVKVGATNVGSIKVVFDEAIATNPYPTQAQEHRTYESVVLDKGAEMARFEFGSTVLLLFEPGQIKEWLVPLEIGTKLRMGEALARTHQPEGK